MKMHKVFMTIVCFLLLLPTVRQDVVYSEDKQDYDSGGDIITNYNYYYNYYYLNDTEFNYVDIYSMNNTDKNSYWRPKYDELDVPMGDYVEFNNKNIKVNKNGFDANWSTVAKNDLPTSRALELLGYDFLLSRDVVDVSTGVIDRTELSSMPITAPVLIMNIYKALGIELYDIYFKFNENDSSGGVYVSRTNPETYWDLFLNDHPIDYSVYNDGNVSDALTGKVVTTADAVAILAQMMDFYGEPIISKHEEYLLLQVYGKDVPSTLEDNQKEAWSYLKCRGIIGEQELNYESNLSFDDMMDLLMRASDTGSRTNFKEVQISTSLDDEFINNGFYENSVKLVNQPNVTPQSVLVDWAGADRVDFLVEINDKTSFRNKNTGRLNDNLFISSGPMHNDKPINGSVYEGIVEGSYYHFSVPRSEVSRTANLYVNSRDMADLPLNYSLDTASGGVYSNYTDGGEGTIAYSSPSSFNEVLPNSMYVDMDRIEYGSSGNVYALTNTSYTVTYPTELLVVAESVSALRTVCSSVVESSDGKSITVVTDPRKMSPNMDSSKVLKVLSNKLVIKPELRYESNQTTVILGLTGDKLLVSLKKAKDINLITNYKVIPDSSLMVIYAKDGSIIVVDNKNKTIQKGNTYLRVKEDQPLFTNKNGEYLVDFRALYGTKETGFSISNNSSGGTTVTMYDNTIVSSKNSISKVGEYIYHNATQVLPYTDGMEILTDMNVNILMAYNDDGSIKEALLPMSSGNAIGNYILHGSFDGSSGQENYKLVTQFPKGSVNGSTNGFNLNDLFYFKPSTLNDSQYGTSIMSIQSKNSYGFKNIPGVGWCYKLDIIDESSTVRFMESYTSQNKVLPFALIMTNGSPKLLNFNINYYSSEDFKGLKSPKGGLSPIPAIVGMQTMFTDPMATASISLDTIKGISSNGSTAPTLYFGTQKVIVDNENFVTKIGKINLNSYLTDNLKVRSMGRTNGTNSEDAYLNPRLFMITSDSYDITLNSDVESNNSSSVSKTEIDMQKFFEQFEGITFMNFIYALDNSMSIAYYIVTRVVPLIILSMLVIMLIISMVSDMKIVQLFCDRVFDPVKLLTFGNHTIQTLRSTTLLVSLVIAVSLMGIIQMGNLEKIIMFFIKVFYSIMSLFG